jgi:acetyl-CoA C-acetyltransferase
VSREAVIVAASRTPIGRAYKGSLVDVRPDDLLATSIREALAQVPELDAHEIVDIHAGCAQPAGEQGFNIGRAAAVLLGLDDVPGTVTNRACASSVQTTRMAAHAILAGAGDVFVSSGVESVSAGVRGTANTWPNTKNPVFESAAELTASRESGVLSGWSDPRERGALPDYYVTMGQTAENVASLRGISRDRQDAWALRSQQRYESARSAGFWKRDITAFVKSDGTVVDADDSPRASTSAAGLASLQAAFRPDGSVTAGNSCPLSDGAAALVVADRAWAQARGITPLARVVTTAVSALSPEIMGLGPVASTRRALEQAGMAVGDLDLVEINEAFAAQVVASVDELGLDEDMVNVNGGAIALGHPFGSTGARITTSLIHALQDADRTTGLVTMCVGTGQGMAMIIERLS